MSSDRGTDAGRVAPQAEGFREAASCFFCGEHRLLEAREAHPGYSDSAFARVEAVNGAWLLRRWPPGFGEERLRFVHRALTESRSRGFDGVPALARTRTGETVVRLAGRLYDAQTLLGGEPLVAQSPGRGSVPNVACGAPPERLAALAEALARFHLSTSGLPPEPGYHAPSLAERLRDLQGEARGRREALGRAVRTWGAGEERETARRWLALLPGALDAARKAVERLPPGGTGEVLCHADLWPAHVRFEGGSFAGFADFESLAFASPALDLAQLVGHFGGWEDAGAVLRSYWAVAPLAEGDEASVAPEAVADLAAEGLWALGELYGGPPGTGPVQEAAHRLNLGLLLDPLRAAADSCTGSAR